MKIVVVGASGFIGSAIYTFLNKTEHEIIAGVRDIQKFAHTPTIQIDFTHIESLMLTKALEGIDVVINAVGIIAPTTHQSFKQMHQTAPITLFEACQKAKVKRVIQISALGTQQGSTPYHQTKNEADIFLRNSGLEYAILHPSIVYGEGGKSTALFQGLSLLPLTPLIGDGSQILQPVAIDDLLATIQTAISSSEKSIELNVVGAEQITYKALLGKFRDYLGGKPAISFTLPTFGTNFIGKLLDEPTINHDNIIMLNEGSYAPIEPLEKFLGYTPLSMEEKLFHTKASFAQRLYSSLYFIRPLLLIVLAFIWIYSGIVSAFFYPKELALNLLHEVGISKPYDIFALYGASFLDITLGVLMLMRYHLQKLLLFQFILIVIYTLIITLFAPYHWLHPFGAIIKNIPLLLSIFILSQLEKFR